MRVVFVNPGIHAMGGAERSLIGLLDGLEKRGTDCHVVVFDEGTFMDVLRQRGTPVWNLNVSEGFRPGARYDSTRKFLFAAVSSLPALARARKRLQQIVDRIQPDVLHSNGVRSHVLLPYIRGPVRKVVSLRDLPQRRIETVTLRHILRRVDAGIANSELLARSFASSSARIDVVPNPVGTPLSRDRLAARQALGLGERAFVIANLAHFHWLKGQLDLVTAMSNLPEDVELVLAGGDLYGAASVKYRKEVETAVAASSGRDRIKLLGVVADVSYVYGAADIVVHASIRPESFGRTVVEAMLSGRPIVASDAGNPGELIRDGETGLLYRAQDIRELVKQILSLRDSPTFAQIIAGKGSEWAKDKFSVDAHASAVASIFGELLGKDPC